MYRFARIAALALTLTVICTAPALAANHAYYVQGTGDPTIATCQPYTGIAGFFRCDSVRAAVDAANANVNSADEIDVIYLQAAGDYTVSQQLTISDRVAILGRGPRTTTVRGAGTARVFNIAAGVEATFSRFGIAGGRAVPGDGGNILNLGTLSMITTRVTGGQAGRGGGIANVGAGQVVVLNSLIDDNDALSLGVGGGIFNEVSNGLSISNSTIAFNTAGGESGQGAGLATTNGATLIGVTIARNQVTSANGVAGLFSGSSANPVDLYGSVIANNTQPSGGLANCGGPGGTDDINQTNVEDGSTCLFEFTGNPGLSPTLANEGGDTDVLTIAPGGIAKARSNPCFVGTDQRNAPRAAAGICDAGAYEQGATAPPIDSNPFGEPTLPPPPPPPPPPVIVPPPAAQEPSPVANQTVVAREVRGTVRIRVRGTNRFVDLDATQGIPVGSTLDTKRGTVEIASVPRPGQPVEKAEFHDGIFRVTQSRGITDLKLTEKLSCSRRANAAQRKPKKRKLWGKGTGKFRTTGSYSAATIRGTEWLVQDTCNSTLTRVKQGVVTVRDKVKKKTVVVRKGKPYVARARR